MTAIIGILNKTTVALASDSAATVQNQAAHKVYNHANKIFNLTPASPVGIAIHNASEVMGIPWETIIKMYRKQFSKQPFQHLNEYGEDLINYVRTTLLTHVTVEEQVEQVVIVTEKVTDELKKYSEQAIKTRFDQLQFEQWPLNEQKEATLSALQEAIHILTAKAGRKSYLPEFEHYTLSEFETSYGGAVKKMLDEAWRETSFDSDESSVFIEQVTDLVHQVICREHFLERWTGIVVAGFGEANLYPQLSSYSVGAVIGGRLRYHERLEEAIAITNKTAAAIAPFAQTDGIMAFLAGIDPALETEVEELMDTTLEQFQQEVLAKLPLENRAELKKQLSEAATLLVQSLGERLEQVCQARHIDPVLDTIVQLSKEDLAEMAESLISLTYLKRRVTFSTESVGGPVDVALITKGDGFVWIKRKHYFQPELNLNYLSSVLQGQSNRNEHAQSQRNILLGSAQEHSQTSDDLESFPSQLNGKHTYNGNNNASGD